MAYIGKKVEETELANRTVDTMTGDGSDTTMSLSATPISVNNVLVFFNGVMQRPTTDFTLSGSTITFAAAPFTGAVVVAITGEGGHIGRPSSPLPTEKFMNSAVTNAKLMSGIASSKLTGAMPALDGSALTGGATGYTESTSDPVITTNPSTGVGTFWVNKSSGEAFCCTDATANANVWVNIGGGSGSVHSPSFQGEITGFTAGGGNSTNITVIDKFSFLSSGNATDHGDLHTGSQGGGASSSTTHGYCMGGYKFGSPDSSNVVNKFAFVSNTTASNIGTINSRRYYLCGASSSTAGYGAGGTSPQVATIQKVLFASDAISVESRTLAPARHGASGSNSTTDAFCAAGLLGSTITAGIDTYNFSSSGNSTDHGNLRGTSQLGAGISSSTHGYYAGRAVGSPSVGAIDKFLFSSNTTAAGHGDLDMGSGGNISGSSGVAYGFAAGGAPNDKSQIDRFAYASDAGASQWGNLTVARAPHGGYQL